MFILSLSHILILRLLKWHLKVLISSVCVHVFLLFLSVCVAVSVTDRQAVDSARE